ncbi:hypothetical protein M3G03_01795 [Aestuariimicrobium sp. p3-SID1156]|uniref:hypothetical protein n=1 Tax=Aestuariimicrobium sp. p3-SID1156 TaxID=2916038 RepID=UPI00223BB34A|nr:hypothetical protein [Aestuariimicrobium sp. p3-SID1156]MCT1458287.1 hypothetical protein [Aestuariimicrobium sp. p3-SID1156]
MSNTTSGLSRRTLAKGAAWSVPVVAVAGAAPAYASSPTKPVIEVSVVPGSGYKQPGNKCKPIFKGYRVSFNLKNTGNTQATLTLTGVDATADGQDITGESTFAYGFVVGGKLVKSVTLEPGEVVELKLGFSNAPTSEGRTLEGTIYYTVEGVAGSASFNEEAKEPLC